MVQFQHLRVILIGGSSHAGKSTLAQSLAAQLGWSYRSTDKLAKHPGRPWRTPPKTVPEHVAAHYRSLSADELIADVVRHYRDTVWPLVEAIVATHATDSSSDRLVMEGSALLPELAATMKFDNVAAVWLTASNELFARRIYQTSEYERKSPDERHLIDRFLARTVRFNERMMKTVRQLGLTSVDFGSTSDMQALTDECLSELKKQD